MELPSFFNDFLSEIRPTDSQLDGSKKGHQVLRDRLLADQQLSNIIVATFLQGSYRRATAIRPTGDQRADVDVIVATKLSSNEFTTEEALGAFVPFVEKYYKGKYHTQSRSIAIELSYVDLDLVVTAAPSESQQHILKEAAVTSTDTPEDVADWRLVKSWVPLEERAKVNWVILADAAKREAEWKAEPLLIPDRDLAKWEKTHPLAQIQWTWDKNRKCNSHYVNVVKAIKWWHRKSFSDSKYPKGYPLEHIIGYCCPGEVNSVAEGVTRAFEAIVARFAGDAIGKRTPFLPNHGIPEQNVLHRLSAEDFLAFYEHCETAAGVARAALDEPDKKESIAKWRELFGDKFPPPDNGEEDGSGGPNKGGFTPRKEVSVITGGRFAH